METSWLLLRPSLFGWDTALGKGPAPSLRLPKKPCVFGKVPLKKLVDSAYVAANK